MKIEEKEHAAFSVPWEEPPLAEGDCLGLLHLRVNELTTVL